LQLSGEKNEQLYRYFRSTRKNISKAIDFYESILDIKIEKMEVQNRKMGILPYEE
jgi:predicted enzyme related to lactoylglutathione lyase